MLFIDRCAWSNRLGDALTAANIAFTPHHEHFEPNSPDEEWLPAVGKKGWLVLTRDKNIRRKPNELRAFKENRVVAIVLTSGQASASDTAELVVRLYPKLLRKIQNAKPPAMFAVTLAGTISSVKL
ncbi:MAG: hypothetical protein HOP24_08560 [Sideroxydans sp.]|nr:hypothetical protein [Sideroxydans sp.]